PEMLSHVGSNLFEGCPRLISVSMPFETVSVGSNILYNDKKLASLSCAAIDAPNAENGAFNGLRYRYVTLTVPTKSFRNYLSAPQWGKFESIQNTIAVSIGAGVKASNAADAEYQDMLNEDALEEAQEAAAMENGEITRTRAERRAVARAKSIQNFASMFDGAQIMPGEEGGATRVFITPDQGVTVTSILFDGEELLPSYDGQSVLLPAGKVGLLKIVTDAPDPVKVESITLSEASVKLHYGTTKQLTATVNPENADNKEIRWTSSDTNLVTVDKNGLITANDGWYSGTATITASATDGSGVKATCEVSVDNYWVSYINLSVSNLYLSVGDQQQVTAYVSPEEAADKSLAWSSDNTDVATVDENGNITAIADGQATITVSALDGSGAVASCYVTVYTPTPDYVYVSSITLSESNLSMEIGGSYVVTASVNPGDANNKELNWYSDNTNIVTVDNYGNIFAVGEGTATITVSSTDGSGIVAYCYVTVDTPTPDFIYVSSISLSDSSKEMNVGDVHTLTAYVYPDEASNKSVSWYSDNETVATVDQNGIVTAMAEGTANIYATATDGSGAQTYCIVTVYDSNTAVDAVAGEEVKVTVEGSEIVVTGAADGCPVALYGADGKVYYSTVSNGAEIRMSIVSGQMYIVKAGNVTKKVMTR
ncbi:MAG: Ig-like domain-containing protein, partial [Muribaculaceae bacterium]|nr:Ig-like domain-containing protein [Muribaculaceae bacterium]